ncbi:hypothetical protein [Mesorhizobium sp. M1312]|uniref:hypothetical protein n=1 Tax=unclassified Mesorhizobium TaxID=325217 RepID=UPI00333833B0
MKYMGGHPLCRSHNVPRDGSIRLALQLHGQQCRAPQCTALMGVPSLRKCSGGSSTSRSRPSYALPTVSLSLVDRLDRQISVRLQSLAQHDLNEVGLGNFHFNCKRRERFIDVWLQSYAGYVPEHQRRPTKDDLEIGATDIRNPVGSVFKLFCEAEACH